MLIAVAPNGARKTRFDHPELPLTPLELAKTAVTCLEEGAGMMHFHVRDSHGKHTLNHAIYRQTLRELEAAVGSDLLLQVSSEAAGIFQANEQIEQMKLLAPHCLSCGLMELVKEQKDYDSGHAFFSEMHRTGAMVQYILYSPAEVEWYEKLCSEGVIPGKNHLLLFVLGKGGQATGEEDSHLQTYVSTLKQNNPWMACGFGLVEHKIMAQVAKLGGHARVGFENNHQLPDGSLAPDNASLVKLTSKLAFSVGRVPGNKLFAESLHKQGG